MNDLLQFVLEEKYLGVRFRDVLTDPTARIKAVTFGILVGCSILDLASRVIFYVCVLRSACGISALSL